MKSIFLRLSVIAIMIGLPSCGPSSSENAECNVPETWSETFERYVDTDVFIDVTVTGETYDVMGIVYRDDDRLGDIVRQRLADDMSTYSVPAQILVRSDPSLSCQRFRKALKVIERNYPCEKKNVCFAAYGLGEDFVPPSNPPPCRFRDCAPIRLTATPGWDADSALRQIEHAQQANDAEESATE